MMKKKTYKDDLQQYKKLRLESNISILFLLNAQYNMKKIIAY